MEIKKVIEKGEILDAEQLAQVVGGTGLMSNDNLAEECTCKGSGDNTNRYKRCYCDGDAPVHLNLSECIGPIDKQTDPNT